MKTSPRQVEYLPDHHFKVGDIVRRFVIGGKDRLGVVLGTGKKTMNYTTLQMNEDACLISFDNEEPVWEAAYFLEKVDAKY